MDDITTPFITAALERRDNPDRPPPPAVPLTDFWLTPLREDDDQ